MPRTRLAAGALLALAFAFWTAGCTSMPRRSARVAEPRTYAIVVADAHGVLSQADLQRVEIGIVQYLLDEGYVRRDQVYIHDMMHADIVFRVQISWQDATAGSFVVAEVVPSYGNGPVPYEAVAEDGPAYLAGYDEPWLNGDAFDGYYYGPWSPFLGVAPFLPIYGWDHPRHPFPPVANRPLADDQQREPRPPPSGGYTRQTPRPWGERAPAGFPDRRPTPPWLYRYHPPQPASTTPHRPNRDSRDVVTSLDPSAARPPPSTTGTAPPPADASSQRQRLPDSGDRSSSGHGRDADSGYRPPPRPAESASAPRYAPPPPRESSPRPSPQVSSPPPSSPPPAPSAPASSPGSDRDTDSRNKADR
jgi:hypothetical protein